MKSISENFYSRGKTYYVRRRIPQALLTAYEGKREIIRNLRTSDKKEAMKLARIQLVLIDTEFAERKEQLQGQQQAQNIRSVSHQNELGARVIPRTRNASEYAVEWPARAESNNKLMSVVKPRSLGRDYWVMDALAGIHRLL